ncbi:MAG: hypothetical protein AMJ75_10510 [Phycisphaerae bacterium SM1_79]|nr:MAG: hypothetical protein AMJ75_10510 [Phycisphaerae bacterium SM1_79]
MAAGTHKKAGKDRPKERYLKLPSHILTMPDLRRARSSCRRTSTAPVKNVLAEQRHTQQDTHGLPSHNLAADSDLTSGRPDSDKIAEATVAPSGPGHIRRSGKCAGCGIAINRSRIQTKTVGLLRKIPQRGGQKRT